MLFESLAVHFGLEQDADQIFARRLAPFFEHGSEELEHLGAADVGCVNACGDRSPLLFGHDVHLVLRVGRSERTVGQLEHQRPVLFLEAHQPADDRQRQLTRNIQHEVARGSSAEPIEDRRGDLSDRGLHGVDGARGEASIDQPAQLDVARRIHGDDAHPAGLGIDVGVQLRVTQTWAADALARDEQVRMA